MICKNCLKENSEGARFCRFCGNALEQETPQVVVRNSQDGYIPVNPAPQVNTVICRQCNAVNKAGMRFCNKCGSPMNMPFEQRFNTGASVYDVAPAPVAAKKKNTTVWITLCIVLLVLVAAAVAVLVILKPFDSSENSTGGQGVVEKESSAYITEESAETTAPIVTVFYNITDEPDKLTEQEAQSLENAISVKETLIGVDIKVMLKKGLAVTAQELADSKCSLQCGSNGILIILDVERNQAALATTGNGAKFVSREIKESIKKEVSELLEKGEYNKACTQAVDMILKSERVSKYEAVEGAQQVVYVEKNSDSNTGKLTLVEWVDGEEEVLCEFKKVYLGMDGITSSPSETKCATPKGTFALGFAFSDRKLNTKLDTEIISSGDVWVDDPDSAYYNTLQSGSTSNSKWSSAENTYYAFSSGIFDACILIEHNGDGYTKGVSGKGSCIYISGKNKELSTSYGDVNISAEQMQTLLSHLDESKNPHIVIK